MKRWRWRDNDTAPPPETDGADSLERAEASQAEALTSLEEALETQAVARDQKSRGLAIAHALALIRAENHFREIWDQGLRGG